jgi:gluconolactonase
VREGTVPLSQTIPLPPPPAFRCPDPAFRILHPSFERYRLASGAVERIAGGCRWAEGPVWLGDTRQLIWSDIPNNRMLRWDEETGAASVFRGPSGHANGNTRDRQGRLVTCEHGGRRVSRTEHDGAITTLLDRFEGKRLNSPNDVAVKSDGSIWFTDPNFGIVGYYQGEKAEPELPERIYRIDPANGVPSIVAEGISGPNGLAFSPDESTLYVIESRGDPRRILAYAVIGDGASLGPPRVLVEAGEGTPDGFRCDVEGNLWCGWGMGDPERDGVRVFSPDGTAIGHISLPERCANLCFGGRWRNRLFMTACSSVYAVYVNTQGAPGG